MKKSIPLLFLTILLVLSSCISNGKPGQSGRPKESTNTSQPRTARDSEASPTQATSDKEDSPVTKTIANPKIQVFLETSGSMNGYVNGGTSIFQQVIKEYLSGINNSGYASEVTYNYITSNITPQTNNLDRYITRLTPSSFTANGNVGTTDIGGIFKKVLSITDPNTISILVSDCIISPGKNVDTKSYLMGQMTDIRNAVVEYTNTYGDLACLVYQFESEFNGNYFDFENNRHRINQRRPFYIWVFGHTLHVAKLKLQFVPDNDFKVTPIKNQWMIFNTSLSDLQTDFQYGVFLPSSINGQYGQYKRVDKYTISSVRKSPSSDSFKFTFGANISLANGLMGSEYVNDTRNYYHMVDKLTKQNFYGKIETDFKQNSPYSNTYIVESEQPFTKGSFSLAFIPQIPNWAEQYSDYDDRIFNGTNNDKTYGLEIIFKGIYNGYNNASKNNIIAQFDFEIK